MPVVTIDWFGGRTSEQMAAIAEQMTRALVEEGNVKPEDVWIRFVDTPKTHWAIDGELQG